MVFDVAWQPLNGLRLAAQAGFDDINASFLGVDDTGSPTIDAYVAGLPPAERDAIRHAIAQMADIRRRATAPRSIDLRHLLETSDDQ